MNVLESFASSSSGSLGIMVTQLDVKASGILGVLFTTGHVL